MLSTLNTLADFSYKRFFTSLNNDEFEYAKDTVYAMWTGVGRMWAVCGSEIQERKVNACYALLIAWYLADNYPERLENIDTDGGRPVTKKTAKSISIEFNLLGLPSALQVLSSNRFGLEAAQMIHNAPEMMGVYGGS